MSRTQVELDSRGSIVATNAAFSRHIGVPASGRVGRSAADFLSAGDSDKKADHDELEHHIRERSHLADDFPGFLYIQLLRPQAGPATHTS